MIHEILPVGMLQCNCSIFGDEQTREALVIDPGDNIEDILAILEKHGLRVKAIVITHAHIDHIGGAAKLKAATGAPVLMNQDDQDSTIIWTCRRPGWVWRHRRIRPSTMRPATAMC
jgi:hydroxyacylglutathione hydrolase